MYEGTLYTKDGSYPQPKLKRIRLADGSTRTQEAVTHQMMLDIGYTVAVDYPNPPSDEPDPANWPVYDWDSETSNWVLKYS